MGTPLLRTEFDMSSNVMTVAETGETAAKTSSVRTESGSRNDLNFTALAFSFIDAEYAKKHVMRRGNSG